jgi:hypothetical protein
MDKTIEMAREAGFTWEPINNIIGPLKRFEQLVRADEREEGQRWFDAVTAQHKQELLAEREACAKVCESLPMQQEIDVRDECAAAIRRRTR